MAKTPVKQENIVEKASTVPVEPSLRQFNIYGITPPSEFALYGTGSKALYDMEVERVTNELRQEVFYSSDSTEVVSDKVERVVSTKKAKKCNAAAIVVFIISILIIALYVLGKFVAPIAGVNSLLFVTDKSGLGVIFDLINVFLKGLPINALVLTTQVAVALVALFSVIIAISSLTIVCRQGIGKLMKALLLINFISTVVIGATVLANKGIMPIGYYILFGLTLISSIIGLFSKKAVKRKK